MTIEKLQLIANSKDWDDLKEYLGDFISDLDKVSEPLEIKGITITPENAYLSKLLAVVTLKDFIRSVDIQKHKEAYRKDGRDSME
jgi:hypothetical protein